MGRREAFNYWRLSNLGRAENYLNVLRSVHFDSSRKLGRLDHDVLILRVSAFGMGLGTTDWRNDYFTDCSFGTKYLDTSC